MPGMVRIPATNVSTFYSSIPPGTDAREAVIEFLLSFAYAGKKKTNERAGSLSCRILDDETRFLTSAEAQLACVGPLALLELV